MKIYNSEILNQVHARFLKITSPPLRLLITSGMIWNLYEWLNKLYSFYVAAIVIIGSGDILRIEVHCRNQLNKSKVWAITFTLTVALNSCSCT